MQLTNADQIKKNRQQLRMNIKSKLRMPARRGSVDNIPLSAQESPERTKLDKRLFENVFEIQEKLGQGAHGVVYKCLQRNTGRQYAVKVMSGDEEMISITKRTYSILKLLDDPRVIKNRYLFVDETRDQIYQVMEYCRYPSLKQLAKEKQLTYEEVKTVIKKLLETTQLINEIGVCHRDLKPDNILYDKDTSNIKIIDFGVSKMVFNRRKRSKDPMWTVTGTIQYKAPEMFEGKAYDMLVDSWAIGVVCYELVYGSLPFESQYVSELIDKILGSQPQYPELADKQQSTLLCDFLKNLLRKQPLNRSSCKEALRHPWIQNFLPKNKRPPSDDFSNSTLITPVRGDSSIMCGSMTYSPPLALSSVMSTHQRSPNTEAKNPMTWSTFKLDVFELKKEVNTPGLSPGKEQEDVSEVVSKEEIEQQIDGELSHSFTIFDPRNRGNSISGPQ